MRCVLALLALVALCAAGCSKRDRLNPLDVGNPVTGGAPEGFNAIADFSTIRLVWTARPDLAIDGYQLYRLAPGDSLYRPLGLQQPAANSSYLDAGVFNGVEYGYQIRYVHDGVPGTAFAQDLAVAGAVRAYVVDGNGGRLVRITPDGRDVLSARTRLGVPFSLAVTQDFGAIWVSDDLDGRVWRIDPSSPESIAIPGLNRPFTIALDPIDQSAWVCDRSGTSGSLHHIAASGAALPGTIGGLLEPSGLATDPRSGTVWVSEQSGDRVRRYSRLGLALGARPVPAPSRIAVDSTTGEAWVTSATTGWVWRFAPDNTVLDSLQLASPIGVALDWRRRTAWVADAQAGQLVGIDMDTRLVRIRIAALAQPYDVAVDLDRGEPWVVARGTASVYRFAPDGTRLGRVNGLGDPWEIRLDRGRL